MADGTVAFAQRIQESGLPKDSLMRFLAAGYVPQPKQLEFHAACRAADETPNAIEIGYGGARGGGKTHCAFAQIAIDDCQRFDNLKVLFLRKIGKYAKESLEDLRRNILQKVAYDFKNNLFQYPNGSRIIAGAYQYEKDIDNYLSLEYDIIFIEQAEQLSKAKIEAISTVNRSSKGFRPRRYYTFNPGGIGHAFLKQKFIEPWRKGTESDTKFIFATVEDNALVNSEYRKVLENLTGWQKQAWLYGDWDILAGQYFSNFNYAKHVVKPFQMPSNAEFWAALDYGFNHPTTFILFAKYDGITYVIGEYGERKTLVRSHADNIKAMLSRHGLSLASLRSIVAGADAFAQRGNESGKTIADQYKEAGIYLRPANTDRISGATNILSMLGDQDKGIEPKLFFFETCAKVIEQLPTMQHDPNRPEDVDKVDIDEDGFGGDDYYDALRYGLMTTNSPGVFF
jgi:phage terminase large subunit